MLPPQLLVSPESLMSKEEKGGSGGIAVLRTPTQPFLSKFSPCPLQSTSHFTFWRFRQQLIPHSGKHLSRESLVFVILWLDFVVFVIGFCDYQITGFPVHGVNSVAMRLCSKSEEVSFGLWCFGREMWKSCWDLRLAKVSMRALGLGKPFLTLPVLA